MITFNGKIMGTTHKENINITVSKVYVLFLVFKFFSHTFNIDECFVCMDISALCTCLNT